MLEIIRTFNFKLINLVIHFIQIYSEPIFKIKTIENTADGVMVVFFDNRARKHRTKSIESLFKNKNLLKCFNGKDASRIGYTYGKILSIKN